SSRSRLLSLDAFRGLLIAAMIVVNDPGGRESYSFLRHSAWNGLSAADLIFPAFLFLVGVSIVFSMERRRLSGAADGELIILAVKRSAVLFALGLVYNGFPLVP